MTNNREQTSSNQRQPDTTRPDSSSGNRGQSISANAALNLQFEGGVDLETEARNIPGLSGEQIQSVLHLLTLKNSGSQENMSGKNVGNFSNTWIIDSGATNHMTGNRDALRYVRKISEVMIGLPDGDQVSACMEGNVELDNCLTLKNVLYVPNLKCDLLSLSQLLDDGNYLVQITNHLCIIQDQFSKTVIGVGKRRGGLYYFPLVSRRRVLQVGVKSTSSLLHNRMGHTSWEVHKLFSKAMGNSSLEKLNKACDVCHCAKHSRTSFSLSHNIANNCFDLMHCDLWGPYRKASSCGAHYFLTIVDDFSRAVWIFLLVDKKSVMRTLLQFFAYVERQFGRKIKGFRSDNGTEFTCMKSYFLDNGIVFQTSCAGTPQQNGCVKRKHRHILNVA